MNSIIIGKNLMKRMLKDVYVFGFIFLLPILAAVLSVVMFGRTEVINVGISNLPKNDYGFVQYLEENNKYKVEFLQEEKIQEKINSKDIRLGIVFPKNFSEFPKSKIKVVSLNNDEKIQSLKGEVEVYIASVMSGKSMPKADKTSNTLKKYEQGRASIGLLSMFILMFAGSSIVFLLQDKREKNFARLFSTPVKEYEVVLAHLVSNLTLGILQISLFLAATTFIFKIQWGTWPGNVYIILIAYLITSVGFSIGLAGIIEDEEKYNLVITLIAVVTSILGGGFMPIDSLNGFIRKISNFTPQKWLIDSYIKLIEGQSIWSIKMNLGILLLFGIVFFTFGVRMVKPGENDL